MFQNYVKGKLIQPVYNRKKIVGCEAIYFSCGGAKAISSCALSTKRVRRARLQRLPALLLIHVFLLRATILKIVDF